MSLLCYLEKTKVPLSAKAIHLASDDLASDDKTFGNFHVKGTVVTFITLHDDQETAEAF